MVDYRSVGSDWTLSVSDNGIGMSSAVQNAKLGLGTNIVESLARRMDADVQVEDANPGNRGVDRSCAQCWFS